MFPEGPINPQKPSRRIPACFRPYRQLLAKIKYVSHPSSFGGTVTVIELLLLSFRDVLSVLSKEELVALERALCTNEGHSFTQSDLPLESREHSVDSLLNASPCSTSGHITYEATAVGNGNEALENGNETFKNGNETFENETNFTETSDRKDWNETVRISSRRFKAFC